MMKRVTIRTYAAAALAGIAVCLVLGWLGLLLLDRMFTRPYSAADLREQWTSDGTLDRLRSWAMHFVGEQGGSYQSVDLPITEPVSVKMADMLKNKEGIVIGVAFELGGADNHHGLIIGDADADADELSWFLVQSQWAEDVWWYDEVPSMDPKHE